jgi:hypothetical protein
VLSDADDLGALGTALLEMTDPAKRLEMSRACLALRQELSIEAHLNRLEQVYTSIISKR